MMVVSVDYCHRSSFKPVFTLLVCCTLLWSTPASSTDFAELQTPSHNKTFTLTTEHLIRGTLLFGDRALWLSFANKLQQQRPTTVFVVGGSISRGHHQCSPHTWDVPSGNSEEDWIKEAWPAFLEQYLNHAFPCGGKQTHSVQNFAQGGCDSSCITQRVLEFGRAGKFAGVDAIIVESSVNDNNEPHGKAPRQTETLASVLLGLPPPLPALLWFGAGSRVSEKGLGEHLWGERDGDVAHFQLPALRHHGIASLSAVDALMPSEDLGRFGFFSSEFRADKCGHISRFAHRFNAALITRLFSAWAESAGRPVASNSSLADAAYAARKYRFISESEAKAFQSGNFTLLDFMIGMWPDEPYKLKNYSGWGQAEDAPKKRGLVSESPGAVATWGFKLDGPSLSGRLMLRFLKSYAHFGTALVKVFTGDIAAGADGKQECPQDQRLWTENHSRTVDCMWDKHESVGDEEAFDFDAKRGGCLIVQVVNVESARPREAKRVKIESVLLL